MKYTDPNINKVVALLAKSKSALDNAFEKALEYQECDQDLHRAREDVQDELDGQQAGEGEATPQSLAGALERLAKIEVRHTMLAGEVAALCRGLNDELGAAGRVSDHFEGKAYPFGMSPL